MRPIRIAIIGVLSLCLSICYSQRSPGRYSESLVCQGRTRTYILRIPKSYDHTKPVPLVIVLHGWGASGSLAEAYTGMGIESERGGFVTAFPNGLGEQKGWNAGFINLTGESKVDDVAFVDNLIAEVSKQVSIDSNRIYLVGHSNGAMLANFAGSRLASKLAAIASVAGTIGISKPQPKPDCGLNVLLIHGTKDEMVAYDKSSRALLRGIGAKQSAQWWSEVDGCSITKTKVNDSVETQTYLNPLTRKDVTLITLRGWGHSWPGGQSFVQQTGSTKPNCPIRAEELIWQFFKDHPRN